MSTTKYQDYELETVLREVDERGFVVIYISRLWRLLGKWSRAQGTWKALLDSWEELGSDYKRSQLHIFETAHEFIVISKIKSQPVAKMAGETS